MPLDFQNAFAGQRNPGSTSSAAFSLVVNTDDNPVDIIDWQSPDIPMMVMPMYFGLDNNGVWRMIDVPSRRVNVAPGVPTLFAPGYLHIMLMHLTSDLPDTFRLTFKIATQGANSVIYDQTVTFQTVSWKQLMLPSTLAGG